VSDHGWGGIVAWAFAMRHPERLERLAILNVPHPAAFPRGLRMPKQLLRSWYVFALQVPGPPGRLVERIAFAYARASLRRDPSRPGTFSEEDVRRYREAMGGGVRLYRVHAPTNFYGNAAFQNGGMILFYDNALPSPPTDEQGRINIKRLIVHEFAHRWDEASGGALSRGLVKETRGFVSPFCFPIHCGVETKDGYRSGYHPGDLFNVPSQYARSSPWEDFAETVANLVYRHNVDEFQDFYGAGSSRVYYILCTLRQRCAGP
jgi:hypothetical protein